MKINLLLICLTFFVFSSFGQSLHDPLLRIKGDVGVDVYFDGKYKGKTKHSDPVMSFRTRAGRHTIKYTRDKHNTIEETITIKRGANVYYLKPLKYVTAQKDDLKWVDKNNLKIIPQKTTKTQMKSIRDELRVFSNNKWNPYSVEKKSAYETTADYNKRVEQAKAKHEEKRKAEANKVFSKYKNKIYYLEVNNVKGSYYADKQSYSSKELYEPVFGRTIEYNSFNKELIRIRRDSPSSSYGFMVKPISKKFSTSDARRLDVLNNGAFKIYFRYAINSWSDKVVIDIVGLEMFMKGEFVDSWGK